MAEKYKDIDPQETKEWIESIEDALEEHGYERTRYLLETHVARNFNASCSQLITQTSFGNCYSFLVKCSKNI